MSIIERLIGEFDRALRVLSGVAQGHRPSPAGELSVLEAEWVDSDPKPGDIANDMSCLAGMWDANKKKHVIGLMRINYAGEICAQALYQGQALTARDPYLSEQLREAAAEEIDHLTWCHQRLEELGGRVSVFNPLWYLGALSFGVVAGWCGDKWSLGFLSETERQVGEHLDEHIQSLPLFDQKTRCILEKMKQEELVHAQTAERLGAAELPSMVIGGMRVVAKAMKKIAFYV